jgi:hypothetical protein
MLPPFRGHRLARLARLAGVVPAVCLTSFLAAASSKGSNDGPCANAVTPSNLDYLVLASFADSPHLLSMAAYHPSHRTPVPVSKPARTVSAASRSTGVDGVSQRHP